MKSSVCSKKCNERKRERQCLCPTRGREIAAMKPVSANDVFQLTTGMQMLMVQHRTK